MVERIAARGRSGSADRDRERGSDSPVSKGGGRNASSGRPSKSGALAKSSEKASKTTIALVYDFDGTLSPRPMQEYAFLPKLGIKPEEFWAECTRLARAEKADPLITYMHLMYKKAKEKGVRVDRADLVAQGRQVEFYPGVDAWFGAISAYVKKRAGGGDISVKHYLVSSGLAEIVEGTKIFKHFANVFASEYWFDAYDIPFPKRVITDTGKTQYLFRINKGREDYNDSINSHMPEAQRPIPFSNMIYFGDGETDVPSMALLKKNGGAAIAVHAPLLAARSDSAASSRPERASATAGHSGLAKCVDLFNAGRCDFYAGADYRRGSDLFKRTCLLLDRIIADIAVREESGRLG